MCLIGSGALATRRIRCQEGCLDSCCAVACGGPLVSAVYGGSSHSRASALESRRIDEVRGPYGGQSNQIGIRRERLYG